MSDQTITADFQASLSRFGRRGTLKHRVLNFPGEEKIWAKTGTIDGVSYIAGTIELKDTTLAPCCYYYQWPGFKIRKHFTGKILFSAQFLLLILTALPSQTLAQSSQFITPSSMQGAVDFWIQIFAQYGKNQLVFHHRDDPAIIYSVLDFRDLAETAFPREIC